MAVQPSRQADKPDDFVIATGETHSVREFVEAAFKHVGVRIAWTGEGVDEIGVASESGETRVRIDPRYFRPAEVELLHGDPTKAAEVLGWKPKVTFQKLVEMMMTADMKDQQREAYLKEGGYEVKRYHE